MKMIEKDDLGFSEAVRLMEQKTFHKYLYHTFELGKMGGEYFQMEIFLPRGSVFPTTIV